MGEGENGEDRFHISDASEKNIEAIVRQVNSKKSRGIDKMSIGDIKRNFDVFLPVTTKMVNLRLNSGKIPNTLKCVVVRPVYKSDLRSVYCDYLPISRLYSLEKILERYIKSHLSECFREKFILQY